MSAEDERPYADKSRNGREVGIEADDGEKCWIVHSDQIEALRALLHPAVPVETSERDEAYTDAVIFGTGFLVGGRRVPPEEVVVIATQPHPDVTGLVEALKLGLELKLGAYPAHGSGFVAVLTAGNLDVFQAKAADALAAFQSRQERA